MQPFIQYITAINRQHKQLALDDFQTISRLNLAPIYQLAVIAGVLFVIAGVSYLAGGHHFTFMPINALSANIPEVVLHLITVFGDGIFLLPLILLVTNKKPQFHWLVFLTAIIGGILSNVLKEYFDALRPPAVLEPGTFNLFGHAYKHHSFPSGHTLTAFLLATAAYYYTNKIWQKVLLIAAATLIGLSRIWLGVHWPIDTLVGGGLGILAGIGGIFLAHKWRAGESEKVHGFILVLMLTACAILLFDKNDYRLALPLLYIVAIWAICRTAVNYLVLNGNTQQPYIEKDNIKLPVINVSADATKIFWVSLFLVTVYRVLVLLQPHFSLFYDEAYYYHWSLNPDLGYYSKPPMVAWSIWLSTTFLGDSVIAIKLMANLLYSASTAVIFFTLKRVSSNTNALMGGLIFITIPMIGFNSEFITTDAPLIFFWCLSLFFALRAIDQPTLNNWLLLGLFTGCGMLSKYTMGALPLGVFGYLLTSKTHRPLLTSTGPWLAAVVAGLIFSLNIYWNHINGWVALHHTQEISQTSGKLFNFASLAEFLASQWIIFGPICSYLLVKSIIVFARQKTPATHNSSSCSKTHFHLLLWLMLTILISISLQAFLSRAFPNWAGPWMVAASILLALTWPAAFSAQRFYTLLAKGLALNLVLVSLFYHWPPMLRWLDIEPSRHNDPFQRVAGWPELAEELKPLLAQYPQAILASDSRDLLAYLGYFAIPGEFNFARWNPDANNIRDYYDLKVNLRQWQNLPEQEFIFVARRELSPTISQQFEQQLPLGIIATEVYRDDVMSVTVTYLKGFKGYRSND